MRSYLSTHHLWAAEHFARLSQEIEDTHSGRSVFDIRHRALVMSAVLAAVAFLEAAVNELLQDVEDEHEPYVRGLDTQTREEMRAYWRESEGRGSILEKYQVALGLARKPPFDRGAQPFQDAALVIKLRNLLVHYRPETVRSGTTETLEAQLGYKFPSNRLMEGAGNPFRLDRCLGAGCAAWAVSTARAFADDAHSRLGVVPNYCLVRWDAGGRPV